MIFTAHGRYPGHRLSGKERYHQLFHYTSFEKFLKIWSSKELWFGVMENVNDIFEQKTSVSSRNPQQMALMRLSQMIIPEYKRISFTMNYDSYFWGCMSPMMWGNYADNGKGICIELDFDRLKLNVPRDCFFSWITYRKAYNPQIHIDPSISTEKELRKFIYKNRKQIFFTKEVSWEKENEFRIVSPTLHHLDISNAIRAIYLTSCNSIETKVVEFLVNEYNSLNEENQIEVKYIHYIYPNNEKVCLPVLSDTKNLRTQLYGPRCKNSFENALDKAIEEKLAEYNKDKNINLLIKEIRLNNN